MPKRKTIRVGDVVKLNQPTQPVKRVGYRLHWTEVEIESNDLKAIAKSADMLPSTAQGRIDEALRRVEVERRGFGGKERVIVRDMDADVLPPGRYRVTAKRIRYTGTYFPPTSGIDPLYGGRWADNGGLRNIATVHLLDLEGCGGDDAFLVRGTVAHIDCEAFEGNGEKKRDA